MMYDRTYYRACSDTRLLEAARDSNHELAIVLGERLEDALHAIAVSDRAEIEDLEREIEDLKDELREAASTIRYLEAELEDNK